MKLKLLDIMKYKHITAYQLSKQTGIPTALFYDLDKGRQKDITLTRAYKIAKALNIKIEDLIQEEDYEK